MSPEIPRQNFQVAENVIETFEKSKENFLMEDKVPSHRSGHKFSKEKYYLISYLQ